MGKFPFIRSVVLSYVTMRYIISGLHRTGRIRLAYLSTIPRIELAEMSSARRIIHLNGIVQIVALYDPAVIRFPSAPTPPPERGVIALDFCAPGKPGSASPPGNGRRTR